MRKIEKERVCRNDKKGGERGRKGTREKKFKRGEKGEVTWEGKGKEDKGRTCRSLQVISGKKKVMGRRGS